jgi:hypothetical protein
METPLRRFERNPSRVSSFLFPTRKESHGHRHPRLGSHRQHPRSAPRGARTPCSDRHSRGPESLAALAAETGATASTVEQAASARDVVIVTIPQKAVPQLPRGLFAGSTAVVVDTGNYYPACDGRIDAIDTGLTDSEWVAQVLGRPVVKAFNNILAASLDSRGTPEGAPGAVRAAADCDHPMPRTARRRGAGAVRRGHREDPPTYAGNGARSDRCLPAVRIKSGARGVTATAIVLPTPNDGATLRSMVGAVIYIRVSTKEQTENLSLPTQLRAYEGNAAARVLKSSSTVAA